MPSRDGRDQLRRRASTLGPRFHNDEQLRRIEFARRWIGDRLRTCKFQKILDPTAGPLIAIREFIISRKSMGGLQTDLDVPRARPRGRADSRACMPRARSAGFGGGGMNGKRGLEGTFLGGCLLGGRIAGRSPEPAPLAAEALSRKSRQKAASDEAVRHPLRQVLHLEREDDLEHAR